MQADPTLATHGRGTIGPVIPVPHHHVHIQHAEGIGGAHNGGKVVTLMDRIGEHAKVGLAPIKDGSNASGSLRGQGLAPSKKRGDTINHLTVLQDAMDTYPRYPDLCGWNALLPTRAATAALEGIEKASVVIVGAGYTGLAAARRWATLRPDDSVVVLDAATVGEGSPGRNSGFMLEIALADDADAQAVARMNAMNALCRDTMGELAALVVDHQIPCDLTHRGTYRAAATARARQPRRLRSLSEGGPAALRTAQRCRPHGAPRHGLLPRRPLLPGLLPGTARSAHPWLG